MSAEELADLICNKGVNFCQNCRVEKYCEWGGEKDCSVVWAEWLNQEQNPLPSFEIADVIETVNNRYVVIWENTVIGVKEYIPLLFLLIFAL